MKYLLFSFLISSLCFSWVLPESFRSTYIELEENILNQTLNNQFKVAKSAISDDVVNMILSDKKNLVSEDFKITEYYEDSVRFWFSIYTQYSSEQVVIHDSENLDLVYNIIDYSEIHSSDINRYAKAKLQADLSLEYTSRLKRILKRLSLDLESYDDEEMGILNAISKSKLKIPSKKGKRKRFFKELANNVRTQTGQRDMVFRGILRSLPYLPFLYKQIDNFKLPREVLSLAFLESSFNPNAESKASAVGAWQFMPYTASHFMPRRTKSIDYRYNTLISSLSAFHLLKQNRMILKRWDLAISAYNSGTKHFVRARRKYKGNPSLQYILEHYKTRHLGFASKNYYSELLALSHVLAYKDLIFSLEGFQKKDTFDVDKINIFVTKCALRPKKFFSLLKKSSPDTDLLNRQFIRPSTTHSRGVLVVSDVNLTPRKYYKLEDSELKKYYPKNFYKLINKKRCGRL